jgi:hypothetical protein
VSNVNLSECLDGRRTDADGGRRTDGRTDGQGIPIKRFKNLLINEILV